MSPTSERPLLRPSVEARVQLDCVELPCVPAEPIPGCQRRLVQDSVPVVVAPSRRTNPDVTHFPPPSPPSTHPVMLKVAYPHPPRHLSRSIALTRQSTLDQPSRVRTTQLRFSCRRRTRGTRRPRTRARANRSRCGGSGRRSSPRRDCTAHYSGIPMAPTRSRLIHEPRLGD
jgi:hypothetical protein